ncbi:uncharacterized protein LOC116261164 [Nymphaea colorata]|uniref:uncharacterized protein LOC116261164 n=1 Tax=Nymphaea colorata TaxID=210225 RepID=UPI00129DEE74|nr:uncharacterized protein LOC116261164 [Nymphaea colorata]
MASEDSKASQETTSENSMGTIAFEDSRAVLETSSEDSKAPQGTTSENSMGTIAFEASRAVPETSSEDSGESVAFEAVQETASVDSRAVLEMLNDELQEQTEFVLGPLKESPTIVGITEEREVIVSIWDNDELETCIIIQRYDPSWNFCMRIPANQEDLKQRAEAAGFKVEVVP